MGQKVTLTSSDGFRFPAYVAEPQGKPRGALIVVQEIFGVNHHIRSVADGYAAEGFVSLAPALFERAQPGFESGYTPEDIEKARALMAKVDVDKAIADVNAAVKHVQQHGKVGLVGYCWGGRVAWVSAAKAEGLACAVAYYGGGIPSLSNLKNKIPVMFHWGQEDQAIPIESVKQFIAEHQDLASSSFIYAGAGHGFNCSERGSYNADAARVARERTLGFLHQHVG